MAEDTAEGGGGASPSVNDMGVLEGLSVTSANNISSANDKGVLASSSVASPNNIASANGMLTGAGDTTEAAVLWSASARGDFTEEKAAKGNRIALQGQPFPPLTLRSSPPRWHMRSIILKPAGLRRRTARMVRETSAVCRRGSSSPPRRLGGL